MKMFLLLVVAPSRTRVERVQLEGVLSNVTLFRPLDADGDAAGAASLPLLMVPSCAPCCWSSFGLDPQSAQAQVEGMRTDSKPFSIKCETKQKWIPIKESRLRSFDSENRFGVI
jgi:hypothetical protein